LFSQIRCTRAVLPLMRARGGGRIVNINAVYGKMPDPAFFATSTNRAACLGFSKALAMELAPEDILVNSVNIGFVDTPQWDNIWRRRAPAMDRAAFLAQMVSFCSLYGPNSCSISRPIAIVSLLRRREPPLTFREVNAARYQSVEPAFACLAGQADA